MEPRDRQGRTLSCRAGKQGDLTLAFLSWIHGSCSRQAASPDCIGPREVPHQGDLETKPVTMSCLGAPGSGLRTGHRKEHPGGTPQEGMGGSKSPGACAACRTPPPLFSQAPRAQDPGSLSSLTFPGLSRGVWGNSEASSREKMSRLCDSVCLQEKKFTKMISFSFQQRKEVYSSRSAARGEPSLNSFPASAIKPLS